VGPAHRQRRRDGDDVRLQYTFKLSFDSGDPADLNLRSLSTPESVEGAYPGTNRVTESRRPSPLAAALTPTPDFRARFCLPNEPCERP
jgi:hypothetical protein